MSNRHGYTQGYSAILLLLFLEARWSFFFHSTSFRCSLFLLQLYLVNLRWSKCLWIDEFFGGLYVHVESWLLGRVWKLREEKKTTAGDHKVRVCHASKISEWHNRTKFKNILPINASVVVCDHETQKRYIILYSATGWCHMHVYVLHFPHDNAPSMYGSRWPKKLPFVKLGF